MKNNKSNHAEDLMASNEKHFDALGFVQKSKELGVNQELAEYQARQLENVIDIASSATKKDVDSREFSTKMDLFKTETVLKADIQAVETKLKIEIQAVRTELKTEIQHLRYDSLKFTIWTGVSLFFSLIVVLAKGFHWI